MLGIVLILTALYFIFFAQRKKNQKDDMPIVDYDITDDESTKEIPAQKQDKPDNDQ